MGQHEWTEHQAEAHAFFAQFIDAGPDVIARVLGERGGNLSAVVAEDKEFGYWARKMTDRAMRRVARERAEWAERMAQFDRLDALRVPTAPAAPIADTEQPALILPEPRIVVLTEDERNETRRWWQRLAEHRGTVTLRSRIRREVRQAEQEEKFARRATTAWQQEQRAFERAQWRAVIARRDARPAKKRANQWLAIDEDRALAIAIAALEQQQKRPPQGRS